MSDLARRLQRIELLLDERIVTKDQLQAAKDLFEAKLLNQQISTQDVEKRTNKIEASLSKVNFALLGAFLTLLILIIVTVLTATGEGGT